jgi:O-antigen ligase
MKNTVQQIWPFKIILALVFLIPLAFSVHSFDKFGIIKLVIFLFGCGLLLFYLFIYHRELANLPKIVSLVMIFFLAVQTFETLRLENPSTGLWGEYGQSESLVVQIGFIILFLAGFLFVQSGQRAKLVDVIMLTVFLVSIFGIAEYFLRDPITKMNVTRIKSFFGDPNSLGAFLVLTLPLIISGFWSAPDKLRRWIAGSSFLTGVIALYLTFSRAAWVSFFVAGFFAWVWGISRRLLKDRSYLKNLIIIVALMVAGVFCGIMLTCLQPLQHADYNLKARVSSIAQGNDSGRHLLWSIALDTFRHSPWTGYGMASFSKNFHVNQSIAASCFWKLDRNISQIHNELLQYLATQGLLGALAYLLLWFVLFWSSNFRDLLKRNPDLEHSCFWMAILGYWVFTQFAYPLVHYTFLVWIYWGIMIGSRNPPVQLKPSLHINRVWTSVVIIALILWGWFLWNVYRADINYQKAFFQARRHLFDASLANYQKAANLAPFQYQYHYRYSLTLYRAAKYYQKQQQPEIAARYLNKAKTGALRLQKQNPGHYQLSFLLGQIAENKADYYTASYYYRQALALFPNNYQLQFRLAKTELLSGNHKAALKAYRAGVQINPSFMRDALAAEHLSVQDFTGNPRP